MKKPKQGEVWLVHFEPQVGKEIKKTRPALVLSHEDMAPLPFRTVVPIRNFREEKAHISHFVEVRPTSKNGLKKRSHVDCVQIKSFALPRFVRKLGVMEKRDIKEVVETMVIFHRI